MLFFIKKQFAYSFTDDEQNLINEVKENPKVTYLELQERLGFNPRKLRELFVALEGKNAIKREGSVRKGHWVLL